MRSMILSIKFKLCEHQIPESAIIGTLACTLPRDARAFDIPAGVYCGRLYSSEDESCCITLCKLPELCCCMRCSRSSEDESYCTS